MRRAALALVALALAACAIRPPAPGTFAFGAFGDTPYFGFEELNFGRLVDTMNAADLAFVVHVGDFKGGSAPCTDALYAERKAWFDRSRHPLAFTPGDNDWIDCRRPGAGGHDPLERLARLRRVFFSGAGFLGGAGGAPMDVMTGCARQGPAGCECPALPENRRWERALDGGRQRVVFATLNVQGSNDNRGFNAANDRESDCRGAANLSWLAQAFRGGRKPDAVVVFFHANPLVKSPDDAFGPLLAALTSATRDFGGPVLVVHGDTHRFRIDKPFKDAQGRTVENLTRLETYGSPHMGWVQVTVDPADPAYFRFTPRNIE